jgi:hypothetical protein
MVAAAALGPTARIIDDEIGQEERQGREAVNAVTADRAAAAAASSLLYRRFHVI